MTGRRVPRALAGAAVVAALALPGRAQAPDPPPAPGGLTGAAAVAAAYDLVIDAGLDALPARLRATCGPAPAEACAVLEAVGLQWDLLLDPADRSRDEELARRIEAAIARTGAWVAREPGRAEAWFYRGAAYGVRVQWHVLRERRLAAARDGKRIREAMQRALALDPSLHDAQFGLGMYEYYADVAPAVLKWFRWILLLPGGDRAEGLGLIRGARTDGQIVAAEADYQLHLIDLWYEHRFDEALAIVRDLGARFPHNPLFPAAEASILASYFDDPAASLAASERLLARARAGEVRHQALAAVTARLGMARALAALGRGAEARALLEAIVAERPAAPADAAVRAARLLATLR
ncbi:MAG: hypothetical protein AB7H88_19155 [Vicinamibacterales bacterium]